MVKAIAEVEHLGGDPKCGGRRLRLFISYAKHDAEAARDLASRLQASGYDVLIDFELPVGDSFSTLLSTAIDEADVVILLMSPAYFRSAWAEMEWTSALSRWLSAERGSMRILPVLLDGRPAEQLANLAYIDASESTRDDLVHSIASVLERQP